MITIYIFVIFKSQLINYAIVIYVIITRQIVIMKNHNKYKNHRDINCNCEILSHNYESQ